ncbi:hypothetical protein LguiB_005617 [Lonicera macranthoides]
MGLTPCLSIIFIVIFKSESYFQDMVDYYSYLRYYYSGFLYWHRTSYILLRNRSSDMRIISVSLAVSSLGSRCLAWVHSGAPQVEFRRQHLKLPTWVTPLNPFRELSGRGGLAKTEVRGS